MEPNSDSQGHSAGSIIATIMTNQNATLAA
jgi:hypothetical protein